MPTVALITAREARELDEDLPLLEAAMRAAGARFEVVNWDDGQRGLGGIRFLP